MGPVPPAAAAGTAPEVRPAPLWPQCLKRKRAPRDLTLGGIPTSCDRPPQLVVASTPRFLLPTVNAHRCRGHVWDREQLAPKPTVCFSSASVSLTPRTALGTLSRSSRQAVVSSGHQTVRPGPIASLWERNGAGQSQERPVPIGAFERSWVEARTEWLAVPPFPRSP